MVVVHQNWASPCKSSQNTPKHCRIASVFPSQKCPRLQQLYRSRPQVKKYSNSCWLPRRRHPWWWFTRIGAHHAKSSQNTPKHCRIASVFQSQKYPRLQQLYRSRPQLKKYSTSCWLPRRRHPWWWFTRIGPHHAKVAQTLQSTAE